MAIIGQTISSPYYNSGNVNSSTGAISGNTNAMPTKTTAPAFQTGGWYGGQQWTGNGWTTTPMGSSSGTNPTSGGGGGGGGGGQPQNQGEPDINALQNEQRGAISSGYDQYFSQLDSILNEGLPQQQTAQQDIANSQYGAGVSQLGFQKQQGLNELGVQQDRTDQSQAKTLRDIGDNLRNSFQAGNVYLGARGAGDSSAANQYAYALTKMGSQQRGDVNQQFQNINQDIQGRQQKLSDTYNNEVNQLEATKNQQISSIAQWFSEQQNALKQAKANGQLQKGQDLASLSQNLLNFAMQNLQTVKAESANKRSALEQWAMNNSTNIQQLTQNMGQISSAPFAQAPNARPITGAVQTQAGGGFTAPAGYGYGNQQETDIFGQSRR